MNHKLNQLLRIIAIIGGIIFGIIRIVNNDIYGSLICFSIIPVMFAPYLLKKIFKIELGEQIETIYYIFVFFAHFLGSIINLYDYIDGYDKIMHFLSGMLSAMIAFVLLVKMKHYKDKNRIFNYLFIISITLTIASLWEFYEFTFDSLFTKDAQNVLTTGVGDTMWDMIVAFFGAILVLIEYTRELISNKKLVVRKFIEEVGVKDERKRKKNSNI